MRTCAADIHGEKRAGPSESEDPVQYLENCDKECPTGRAGRGYMRSSLRHLGTAEGLCGSRPESPVLQRDDRQQSPWKGRGLQRNAGPIHLLRE